MPSQQLRQIFEAIVGCAVLREGNGHIRQPEHADVSLRSNLHWSKARAGRPEVWLQAGMCHALHNILEVLS